MGCLSAQESRAQRVKGGNPHLAAVDAQQGLDASAHFLGGLVRERDGEDSVGLGQTLADEIRNAVSDDASLPRTGAGENQQRTVGLEDGGLLLGVERGEEIHSLLFYRYALGKIPWLIDVTAAARPQCGTPATAAESS